VLNAREDADEAEIVAKAGQPARITVATNMAGRGTDIELHPAVRGAGGLHVILTEYRDRPGLIASFSVAPAARGILGHSKASFRFATTCLRVSPGDKSPGLFRALRPRMGKRQQHIAICCVDGAKRLPSACVRTPEAALLRRASAFRTPSALREIRNRFRNLQCRPRRFLGTTSFFL
jgi:hypothetical protein